MWIPLCSVAAAGPVVTETLGSDAIPSQDADWAYKTDVIEVREPVRLISVAPWVAWDPLNNVGPDLLNFVVYQETTPNQWALVWASPDTPVGQRLDFKESPEIGLDLAPGRYAVGMYFPEGNYVYAYDLSGPRADWGWGEFGGSVWSSTDTTFSLPTVINQAPSATGYYMQVTVELVDDADQDGFEASEDCDDDDPTRYPGAPELCDGRDNDCNGQIDDQVVSVTWHADTDGDGYGDPADVLSVCDGSRPSGYTLDDLDCDDTDARINPDAVELCDGRDDDCNGLVDDDPFTVTLYADQDGDGFGDPSAPSELCDGSEPVGFVPNDLDCDDADADSRPGAPEICDGKDNDCDAAVDEDQSIVTFYADLDGDGFGDASVPVPSCDGPPPGAVDDRTDCDDTDAERFPGNDERCDGKDNDCDGLAGGEGDFDGDGWLDCEDCRSDDPTTYPGAIERCDGLDHDCDGQIPAPLDCDPAPDEPVRVRVACGCAAGPSQGWAALPLLALVLSRRTKVAGRTRLR